MSKFVLLIFWAAFDPMSRINNQEVIQLYEEYRHYTFAGDSLTLQFNSLDLYKSPYKHAILVDGLQEYSNTCDFLGLNSPIAQQYKIPGSITLLLDSSGRVIARDFHTKALRATLDFFKDP